MRDLTVLLGCLPLLLGAVACTGDDGGPQADPSVAATPLQDFSTSGIAVTRGEFCDQVPEGAAEQALGGAVARTGHYGTGDRAAVTTGVKDVAHEFNCTFVAGDGTRARAWVFAPPVTVQRAKQLARETRRGCTVPTGAAKFGQPSVATVCRHSGRVETAYRGLFGDAWLSCSVSTEKPERTERLGRAGSWCVRVVEATRAD